MVWFGIGEFSIPEKISIKTTFNRTEGIFMILFNIGARQVSRMKGLKPRMIQ